MDWNILTLGSQILSTYPASQDVQNNENSIKTIQSTNTYTSVDVNICIYSELIALSEVMALARAQIIRAHYTCV